MFWVQQVQASAAVEISKNTKNSADGILSTLSRSKRISLSYVVLMASKTEEAVVATSETTTTIEGGEKERARMHLRETILSILKRRAPGKTC